MPNRIQRIPLSILSALCIPLLHAAELDVEIQHVPNQHGHLAIGLYTNAATFPNDQQEFRGARVPAQPGTLTYTFSDIPEGTYAVAVYHDQNDNGHMDKNFFGIPKEPYGFSRIGKPGLGAPDFSEAAFEVPETARTTVLLKQ